MFLLPPQDAEPCLFIFDCLFYNGRNWMGKPLEERRRLLEELLTPSTNIRLSELTKVPLLLLPLLLPSSSSPSSPLPTPGA